jgi:acetyltransferase-like isoleucine patch superfamily enzyme
MIYSVNTIEGTRGPVVLKKGCRMGANCVVLPGVTIGEGAVIGACSLVKSDVPSYEVWGGVPAKRLDTLHP